MIKVFWPDLTMKFSRFFEGGCEGGGGGVVTFVSVYLEVLFFFLLPNNINVIYFPCLWASWEMTGCTSNSQALVYDILPSTIAIFSYAIDSRKLSANEQFFGGAQTVVSLLQTTQIISDVCFITDHSAYTSSNKTKIIWIETELFLVPGADACHAYMHAWALGCFHSLISTQIFRRALTASLVSCAEIKSTPSVA